ncbi:histidine kinase [Pilimelia anulata]|uniref:histidine kinase n=1 Tax=Pilimelia anulata TaxID=53371 RepID=A0A8J3BD30_9ACTN|nr:sensor histidine kinase [Pilimelia anulata]GGJ98070.1 histidine kinase [Pilimelia anulata]
MRPERVGLRTRVTALCAAVGLLLLAVAGGATILASRSRGHTDRLANEIKPARTAVEALRSGAIEQRSSMRGYAATSDANELGAYRRSAAEQQRLAADLHRLFAGEPALTAQLDAVLAASDRWRSQVAEPIIAATAAGGPTAGQAAIRRVTGEQFTELRNELDALLLRLIQRTDDAVDAVRALANQLYLLLAAAAVFVLLAAILLVVIIQRWVIRPVTRLAGEVRLVAAGDFGHRIAPAGPAELNRLAADVETMRQRIGADLDAVRAARREVEAANAALEAQAAELTRSNRDLEQFAYVASHDLQEPLRKVASFCQLLQRRYLGQLDDKADQYLNFAIDGAQRMQRLINDLLAFSRIGRRRTEFAPLDLDTVLGDVREQLDGAILAAGGTVRWSGLPTVVGEESLLSAVFANLVGNALKFRRPDAPPEVEVSARRVGDEWELTVADNGIGIGPEFVDKVFVIFQRLHGRDAYPGTGIGLAIVKKIIEYHGGRVWVEPREAPDADPGTVIRFTLPATAAPTGATAAPEEVTG